MMPAAAITTGYGPRLTVDLGALVRNWQALDRVTNGVANQRPPVLTGAVVKADAYGTGINAASKAFSNTLAKASRFSRQAASVWAARRLEKPLPASP